MDYYIGMKLFSADIFGEMFNICHMGKKGYKNTYIQNADSVKKMHVGKNQNIVD